MKHDANKLLVATVKKLLHHGAHPQLIKLIGHTHPADLAFVFNRLTKSDRLEFFPLVSNQQAAAELLTESEPAVCRDFLDELPEGQIVALLEQMSGDDVADLLSYIDDEARLELILTMMQREELAATQTLLEHDPQSAGGLMVPDFLALSEEMTARQALERLQEDAGHAEVVLYLYVVDDHHHLVGVTSLRELVRSHAERPIKEFMIRQVIRVSADTDQEEVARLIARYNLIALPVVDPNNTLLGIVTVDDIIDVIRSEATEDMMLMAGAGQEQSEGLYLGLLDSVRSRSPWLLPSALSGAFALALIAAVREVLVVEIAWIALLPWVLTLCGSLAMQSGVIATRGLILRRTAFSRRGQVLLNELAIGALSGLLWSVLGALAIYALTRSGALPSRLGAAAVALRCGVTMWFSATIATALGAALPLTFARFGRDPAVGTGPLSAALVHAMTLTIWTSAALTLLA